MRACAYLLSVALCIPVVSGCSHMAREPAADRGSASTPALDRPISVQSPSYPLAVAAANKLVSEAGLKWGSPTDVQWQPTPLDRYLVIYATPQSELGYAGHRAVHVDTNWHAWFTPRE
jgi:hypothetical protein